MGVIKNFDYTPQSLTISLIGRALAHPCRVSIIELLINSPQLSNQDIATHFNMNRSTIHEHLIKLWEADLIYMTSSNGYNIASVRKDQIEKFKHLSALYSFHSKKAFHLGVLD